MECLSDLNIETKDDPNEFDLTVASLLVGLGAEEYIEIFRQNNIGQATLVELTDEDLEKLGVNDAVIREKIINEVCSLPIYEENLGILNETTLDDFSAEEMAQILENTSKHLYHIELSVISNKIALKNNKNFKDCLVYKNVYASDVGIKTIDAILDTLNDMEKVLEANDKTTYKKQKRKRKKMLVSAIGSSVIITLAILFYKSLKNL